MKTWPSTTSRMESISKLAILRFSRTWKQNTSNISHSINISSIIIIKHHIHLAIASKFRCTIGNSLYDNLAPYQTCVFDTRHEDKATLAYALYVRMRSILKCAARGKITVIATLSIQWANTLLYGENVFLATLLTFLQRTSMFVNFHGSYPMVVPIYWAPLILDWWTRRTWADRDDTRHDIFVVLPSLYRHLYPTLYVWPYQADLCRQVAYTVLSLIIGRHLYQWSNKTTISYSFCSSGS